MTTAVSRKYLYIHGYPGIAIPLESLQACSDIRYVSRKVMKVGDDWVTYYYDEKEERSREAAVIFAADILPKEPKEEEESR
jgi:hypothetical protein